MDFKNQKFLVAGMSKSGESSTRFLLNRGAQVYVYDDVLTDATRAVMARLQELGAIVVTAETFEQAVSASDVLVISPGIPIDNPLPVRFRKEGKAILGEEELGALYLRATAVAVTGTNGKTTTVSLIHAILTAAGKNSTLCGNVGNPLVGEVERLGFDDYAVIEISSFQLETLLSLKPHIAVITNITEDHLNRHYNMENYIYLKSRLIRGLHESEFAVLNYDDERVRALASFTKAKVVWFSARQKVNGAYAQEDAIFWQGERVVEISKLQLKGLHNVYNVLAAITCAMLLHIDPKVVAQSVCEFKGVKHRIEKVAEKNGITYINDSKATNVDATVQAVNCMTLPTVLLLGGKNKGYDYEPLFAVLKNSRVVHTVLYGENRFQLLDAAVKEGFVAFSLCANLEQAVHLASFVAQKGQCVLLSPASSSFDLFANYEERGDAFVKLVEGIHEKQPS